MKKITLSLIAACSLTSAFSQVVLQENFTSPFSPAAAGWIVQNNSIPQGTVSWAQGNMTGGNNGLVAYNGNTNDFYMADFLSVDANSSGGISAFLITPTVTIYNGAVLQFATSTLSTTTIYADRLQVLMSQVQSPTIPTGTTSVGPFTTTLLDINPLLGQGTTSVVSNGTVNGYPQSWTVYTLQVTGVTNTVTGRFAFRYFVNDGGINGANSRLVGVDAVKYTLPCGPAVTSYTACSGTNVTLNATGGLPATTYSWSTGATTSSVSVNPSATTVYTLYPSANGNACGTNQTATITVASALSMNISASSTTICAGTPVLLGSTSAATAIAWVSSTNGATPIATTASVIVSPTVTTTYSVGGQNGACLGTNSITVNVNALPSISVALSPACIGGSITILASGAASYTYLASNSNPQSIATPTATGGYNFVLSGSASNGCVASGLVNFTVNPAAAIAVIVSKPIICVNQTSTLTASGAATYTWSGTSTASTSAVTYTGTLPAGNKSFTVTGTDANGCTATVVKTVSVSACTGIETLSGNSEAAVYPNPFTNELKISGVSGNVEIYNSLGQLVHTSKVSESGTVNTGDFSKGAYILKAYNNDGQLEKTIKLLKN